MNLKRSSTAKQVVAQYKWFLHQVLFDWLDATLRFALPTRSRGSLRILDLSGRVAVEVSGGVTLLSVREYAEAGPDYIAIGALTHSAPAVDISFEIEPLGADGTGARGAGDGG
jgi:hypothetical protein